MDLTRNNQMNQLSRRRRWRSGSEFYRTRPGQISTVALFVLLISSCCEARLLAKNHSHVTNEILNMTEHGSASSAHQTASTGMSSLGQTKGEVAPVGKAKKREPIPEEEEEEEEDWGEEEEEHQVFVPADTVFKPPPPPSFTPTPTFDDELSSHSDDLFKEPIFVRDQPPALPTNFVIIAAVIGILLMIFTAWQMSDNPDGVFASCCRLILSAIQLILRILSSPCRKCCGYNEPYGRINTMDYGYKDPALELS